MIIVFTLGPGFVKVRLVMRLAKALFGDQVGQFKDQDGQDQGPKLDNISDFKAEL